MAEKCVCHINGYQIKDATARKTLENHTPRIAAVETTTRSLVESADDHELRIAAIENSAPSTGDGSSSASNHESRIAKLEDDVSLNMYNISDNNNRITELEGKDEENKNVHEDLRQDVDKNANDITELESRTTAVEIATDTHGDEISNLQTDVSSIKTTNATQTTNISNLTSRVTAVETKNSSQDTKISAIESKNTTQDTNISNLTSRVTAIETKNTSQDSEIEDIKSRLDSVENADSGNSCDCKPLDSYPVGSIYMSTKSTSPASLFGGTWSALPGRFLLGAGTTSSEGISYTAGNTGGKSAQTVPAHTHTGLTIDSSYVIKAKTIGTGSGNTTALGIESSGGNSIKIGETGSPAAGLNMPPYLVVYMWKRTA